VPTQLTLFDEEWEGGLNLRALGKSEEGSLGSCIAKNERPRQEKKN